MPIKKDSSTKNDARYIFIFFLVCGKIKIIHANIKNVDKTIKGIDNPSTPRENLKLSLLNHEKVFTNWKWGIVLSKFIGR